MGSYSKDGGGNISSMNPNMTKPKSTMTVMAALKKELEAESPEQVLEKIQALKAAAVNDQGPIGVMLTMARTTLKYNHALTGLVNLEDWRWAQGMVEHFLREVLNPQVRQMEVEVEVQRRLEEHQQP